MLWLALALAHASEVTIRNDTAYDDTYDTSDEVAWLEYPECAISVFSGADYTLPLSVDAIDLFLGANTDAYDGETTYVEISLQILDEGADPSLGPYDWGTDAFSATISTTGLNQLSLVDTDNGWSALEWDSGDLAVFVCPTDPETGDAWPSSGTNTSGVVIDTGSPSDGNWLYYCPSSSTCKLTELSHLVAGSWIIRAEAEGTGGGTDSGGSGGTDTGPVDTGGGSGGGSGGSGGSGSGDTQADTDADQSPELLSIYPNTMTEGQATPIALVGSGFQEGAQVYIGGLVASSVVLAGDTTLTATSPTALPVGTHDVMVTNPGGLSSTLAGGFTVVAADSGDAKSGCGCASGPGSAMGAWLLLPLALAWTRRRR